MYRWVRYKSRRIYGNVNQRDNTGRTRATKRVSKQGAEEKRRAQCPSERMARYRRLHIRTMYRPELGAL